MHGSRGTIDWFISIVVVVVAAGCGPAVEASDLDLEAAASPCQAATRAHVATHRRDPALVKLASGAVRGVVDKGMR
jgi:hypothetical protein